MKIKLTIEVELIDVFDLPDDEEKTWFENDVLFGNEKLRLFSHEIGDFIGVVKNVSDIRYISETCDNAFEEATNETQRIHDVLALLFDEVAKNTNADKDRVVAGYNNGKLCFYELDLHEETVIRYLTTLSLKVNKLNV